jgi:CheY-like chemotaxis protein
MKKPAVLIIDDDPSHLRIYGWIIQSAGFESASALVTFDALDLPDGEIDLVLLDYHLHGKMTATEIAKLLRERYSGAPIFVLSDAMMMPDDIAPFVDGFIRKGDPARLVKTISERLMNCVIANATDERVSEGTD